MGTIKADEAYAISSWERFDEEVSDDLLRAVCGAFAVVATADGDLAFSEIDRFISVLRTKAHVFGRVDFARIEEIFRDLAEALLSEPAAGRRRALEYVGAVKDQAMHRELVRSAALIAVQADGREKPIEQTAMRVICIALGMDE